MANANDISRELLRLVGARAEGGPAPAGGATPVLRLTPETGPDANDSAGADRAASPLTELQQELQALRRQLGALQETSQRQTDELAQNTRAVADAGARSGRTAGTVAENVLSGVTGAGGLSVLGSPLVGLITRLFRRRESEPATALPVVNEPAPIREDLALPSGLGSLSRVAYRADGLPRPSTPSVESSRQPAVPNLTIQVQAMDSRSFLDNSEQIARAVREAMLHSHALNDVIGEM